jgi:ABC-type branched-subunit amino acid transport system ATPase component
MDGIEATIRTSGMSKAFDGHVVVDKVELLVKSREIFLLTAPTAPASRP